MKFGQVDPSILSSINFSLPSKPEYTIELLNHPEETQPKIQIGGPQWGIKGYKGLIYPSNAKQADFLYYYSRAFSTIELNATFYRWPSTDQWKKWAVMTPDSFTFCPKVPNTISQYGSLREKAANLNIIFNELQESIGSSKIGTFFMQLPEHFSIQKYPELSLFIEDLSADIPLMIELRHESWFNESETWQDFVALCAAKNIGLVMSDVSGRRDVLHMAVTNRKTFVRFVGNKNHPTNYQRLDEWIAQFDSWLKRGLQEIYFMIHTPDELEVPQLATYFGYEMKKKGYEVSIPQLITPSLGF